MLLQNYVLIFVSIVMFDYTTSFYGHLYLDYRGAFMLQNCPEFFTFPHYIAL